MTTVLWIGFGFVALLVVFLIFAFFLQRRLTDDQRRILRFLTSLCGGFAGGLITGEALFQLSAETDLLSMSVTGAAGFALFFVVWFTYGKTGLLPDSIVYFVPEGWNFQAVISSLATTHGRVATLEGFTDDQKAAPLRSGEIEAKTMKDALTAVGKLAKPDALPEYRVTEPDSTQIRLVAEE